MPTLQPIITTTDEIQDAAIFVDGAGGTVQQSPGLYQRLKDTVYEVLKGGGLIK